MKRIALCALLAACTINTSNTGGDDMHMDDMDMDDGMPGSTGPTSVTGSTGMTGSTGPTDDMMMPVNHAPTITASASVSTAEDTPLTFLATLADADNDTLTADIIEQPLHGALDIVVNGTSASITYTPDFNYNGSETITVVAYDSHDAASAELTISITVTPVADRVEAADDLVTAVVNASTVFTTITNNDFDPDMSPPLTITSVDTVSARGVPLSIGSSGVLYDARGLLLSVPAGSNDQDNFTYVVSNASGSTGTATVTVQYSGVNDPPAITPGQVAVCKNGEAGDYTVLATDPDTGTTLTFTQLSSTCDNSALTVDGGVLSGACPTLGSDCIITFEAHDGTIGVTGTLVVSANSIFVAPTGTGNGSSWTSARGNVQEAADAARVSGRDVLLSNERFETPPTQPNQQTLLMLNGATGPIRFYGGFDESELTINDRRADQYSIFTGDRLSQPLSGDAAGPTVYLSGAGKLSFDHIRFTDARSLPTQSGAQGAAMQVKLGDTVSFTDCTFENNTAESDAGFAAQGAAIWAFENAPLTFERTVFYNNTAYAGLSATSTDEQGGVGRSASGGAISAAETSLSFVDCVFQTNAAIARDGGAPGTITASSEWGNGGDGSGGAISMHDTQGMPASLTLTRTAFMNNRVTGGYGGTAVGTGRGGNGGSANGGAVSVNLHTPVIVVDSHFDDNRATGGYGGDSAEGATGSVGSPGAAGGDGGSGEGGAIYAIFTEIHISNTRFRVNYAYGGGGAAGGQGGSGFVGGPGGAGGRGGDATGGALSVTAGSGATISNTTFRGCVAEINPGGVGGTGGKGDTTAGVGGPGGDGGDLGTVTGGAVYTRNARVTIDQSSFTRDVNYNNEFYAAAPGVGGDGSVDGPAGAIGGFAPSGAGAVDAMPLASVTVTNSVFADNEGAYPDLLPGTSLGHSCVQQAGFTDSIGFEPFDSSNGATSGEAFLSDLGPLDCFGRAQAGDLSDSTSVFAGTADTQGNAGAHYSLTDGPITTTNFPVPNEVVVGHPRGDTCELIQFTPFARYSATASAGEVTFSYAADPGSLALVRCGLSIIPLSLP